MCIILGGDEDVIGCIVVVWYVMSSSEVDRRELSSVCLFVCSFDDCLDVGIVEVMLMGNFFVYDVIVKVIYGFLVYMFCEIVGLCLYGYSDMFCLNVMIGRFDVCGVLI